MVIYYEGKYYDTNLKKLTQHDLKRRSIKFLAVDPAISTAEAVRVRTKFPSTSLAVTLLNDEWLKALKEKEK